MPQYFKARLWRQYHLIESSGRRDGGFVHPRKRGVAGGRGVALQYRFLGLGYDTAGCLITGEDAVRPQRKSMGNPVRNVYPTKDKRWIMLGMTNAQHYWPNFCKTIGRPELENYPKFATLKTREQNAPGLVKIIEQIFCGKTFSEWVTILSQQT
jgi:crotonobetainyl-CoA:carnitine CoA-transferase CaiB-like acyl-CoA transferase